jgi:hypothetical protein
MVQQLNAKEVKKKISDFLELVGPSLPIHVAKHLQMNTLFASAFLSEMASEGIVKITDMKVGGSPLYYTPSKLALLENHINSLGGKEKEACNLLKEKGILSDTEQHPAIRVALRSLKDFAFPFKYDNKIYWKYFILEENKALEILNNNFLPQKTNSEEVKIEEKQEIEEEPISKSKIQEKQEEQEPAIKEQENNQELKSMEKELLEKQLELDKARREIESLKKETIENSEAKNTINKEKPIKTKINKKVKPLNEFLEQVKRILETRNITLVSLERADKKEIFAIIKKEGKELLLAAFNKKKIEEQDILKASKKASLKGLDYTIFSKGEASEKAKKTIEAYKKLTSIESLPSEQKTLE